MTRGAGWRTRLIHGRQIEREHLELAAAISRRIARDARPYVELIRVRRDDVKSVGVSSRWRPVAIRVGAGRWQGRRGIVEPHRRVRHGVDFVTFVSKVIDVATVCAGKQPRPICPCRIVGERRPCRERAHTEIVEVVSCPAVTVRGTKSARCPGWSSRLRP